MSLSKARPGSKQTSCKPCHDRKVKCSKTQPCSNCTRRGEQCVWLGEAPPPPPVHNPEGGLTSEAVNRVERLRIESSDPEQRFRVAVGALARYLLPVQFLYPMLASSLNDSHVTAGWIPLEAAQASLREFLTRHEARAYRKNDAQFVALCLAVIGERLAFCPNSHGMMDRARAEENINLPPTLTGYYTNSAPAYELAPHEMSRCYAAQAEFAMQLAYEQEEPAPISWHALWILHRLEANLYSSRHIGSAMRQLIARNLHRPPAFQEDTTIQWKEHRLRFWHGMYWEDRMHAVILRRPRNSHVIDDLPPPLNMSQEQVCALTEPVKEPPSYTEVNDGSSLVWRAMLARCLDGVIDEQQHLQTPKDVIPLDKALYHSRILANLRDKMPEKLRVGTAGAIPSLKVQRDQIAAVIACVQLKLLGVHVVDGLRCNAPEVEAEALAFDACAELVKVIQELTAGGSPLAATSAPALAFIFSPILLFEATALLVLGLALHNDFPHQHIYETRLGISFLQPQAQQQRVLQNCIGIMIELLAKRGIDLSQPLPPVQPLIMPEVFAGCRPVLDKKVTSLLFDASGSDSLHHQAIIKDYSPYMGNTRGVLSKTAINAFTPNAAETLPASFPPATVPVLDFDMPLNAILPDFPIPTSGEMEIDTSVDMGNFDWLLPDTNGMAVSSTAQYGGYGGVDTNMTV